MLSPVTNDPMRTHFTILAESIASHAHNGQFRRDGVTPYINHPRAVVELLKDHFYNDHIIAAAWLHDVLEDTPMTAQELLKLGMGSEVVYLVKLLTKDPDDDYLAYLQRIKSNRNARLIKIADMLSNLCDSPSRNQKTRYSNGIMFLSQ